ncbi:hypothetical protein GCM10012275_04740 [Longimycelium tulufanense]|uniref:protein-serine/threonine phosphatase n=1 Tax=Longimycelium tulufanense TaxID=907463 RepID=A0A8J3CBV9_9PSEU|nr:SpoIIE family protein phosphatase [Longimycelium tulufanense]GGM36602.1 hypothetical protein GCM10012275_04740 [Longimycelium tulufanense]
MSPPGPAVLPEGIESAPTPVLVVDLSTRSVVRANEAAATLTPGVRLPVDVDAWGKAAGLTDVDGRPLGDPWSPLHRAAGGQHVAGEPVCVGGNEHDVLWLTAVPLPGHGPQGVALVVLVRLAEDEGLLDRWLDLLRSRALANTDAAVVVTDAGGPDFPIRWVNPAFTRMAGYEPHEVLGRSTTLLHGRDTDPVVADRLLRAMRDRRPATEVLLNYRRNGTAFWNEVRVSPVQDSTGRLTNFVLVQSDVTERVLVEHQRRAALAAAEETRQHLRLLTEATTSLTATLDTVGAARLLARLVVPSMADFCCVDLLDEPGVGAASRVAATHRVADRVGVLYRIGELVSPRVGGSGPVSRVLSGGPPVLIPEMPSDRPIVAANDPEMVRLFRELRPMSMVVVPLRARGRVLGAMVLGTERPYGRRYTQSDLDLASNLAGRAALAVDNARLYVREHQAALTLQQSLLPEPPEVPGLALAARYLVGAGEAEVGGDWYDVLPLPDGAVGLVVGDVVGHDLRAAAAMGQLRGLLRACAWEGRGPGAVLDRCDEMVHELRMGSMATAACLRLEPHNGAARRKLQVANAGHPAPLIRTPDGTVDWLTSPRSPLLGALRGVERRESRVDCPDGSLLVLYTDGIIEVRGADPDELTDRLRDVVAGLGDDCPVEEICDRILAAMYTPACQDDVALLVVRVVG